MKKGSKNGKSFFMNVSYNLTIQPSKGLHNQVVKNRCTLLYLYLWPLLHGNRRTGKPTRGLGGEGMVQLYLTQSGGFFVLGFNLTHGGFIKGILRGVRCTKSLRVLFLHRRPPSWTTLVLYSRAVFIFNEPASTLHSNDLIFT